MEHMDQAKREAANGKTVQFLLIYVTLDLVCVVFVIPIVQQVDARRNEILKVGTALGPLLLLPPP